MSFTPDPHNSYTPADPSEMLERTRQRSSRLRRRRRLGLSAGGAASAGAAIALLVVFLPSGATPTPKGPFPGGIQVAARIGGAEELTAAVSPGRKAPAQVAAAVEHAEVGLSLSLLDKLAAGSDASNQLVSPSSLATALAMLEVGAAGPTQHAIATTLETEHLSSAQQAAGWGTLAGILAAETSRSGANLAAEPQLDNADALWIQQGLHVRPQFVRSLTSSFGAGVWQANFATDPSGAVAAINQWTIEHTDGLIKQLFSKGTIDQSTELVLANAVFFHAHWAQAFVKTLPGEFILPTGKTEAVSYMQSEPPGGDDQPAVLRAPAAVTGSYSAVELPYAGKHLSALVVMPHSESLAHFVSTMSPTSITRIVHSLRTSDSLELEMPTFTMESDNLLNDTLSGLGMSQAFGPRADFDNIVPDGGLSVGTVEQHAYLRVTPIGTTAAAATGVGVLSSAEHVTAIDINHPFLFMIRDNGTGAVLFASMIEDPTAG